MSSTVDEQARALWKNILQQPEFEQIRPNLELYYHLIGFNLRITTATLQVYNEDIGKSIRPYLPNIESAFASALRCRISIRLQVQGEVSLSPDRPEANNQGVGASIECYGLNFRSQSEMNIAHVLEKRKVLYFPNAKGRLLERFDGGPYCPSGERRVNKEADFLICQEGSWGILECDGDEFHKSAAEDHARDRVWNANGIWFIKRFLATECYSNPEGVVDQFLELLRAFASQTHRSTVLSNEISELKKTVSALTQTAIIHEKKVNQLLGNSTTRDSDRLD